MPTDERLTDDQKRLVESCQGLVRSIASTKRATTDAEFDDLVSAGNAALCRAAKKYDDARGAKFSTYAYKKIKGAILDRIAEVRRVKSTEYPQMDVRRSAVDPDDYAFSRVLHDDLACALDRLRDDERAVVSLLFGFDGSGRRTITEASEALGWSIERVMLTESAALDELREQVPHLADYFDDWEA
ncbi:MAG: sigma-70 family RNA polymerase sigma factor [Coriobacteriia bacterium]|nr:sigma-70 family RNA polymerase sigma factor [Coriobacteriia bacterium]